MAENDIPLDSMSLGGYRCGKPLLPSCGGDNTVLTGCVVLCVQANSRFLQDQGSLARSIDVNSDQC